MMAPNLRMRPRPREHRTPNVQPNTVTRAQVAAVMRQLRAADRAAGKHAQKEEQ